MHLAFIFIAGSVADVQTAIEHIFPLVYEFRKKRAVPIEVPPPTETIEIDNDDEMVGASSECTSKNPIKKKAIKRKYPFGFAENDPEEDIMAISEVESDQDDENDEF